MDFTVQRVFDTSKCCPDFYNVSVASLKRTQSPRSILQHAVAVNLLKGWLLQYLTVLAVFAIIR